MPLELSSELAQINVLMQEYLKLSSKIKFLEEAKEKFKNKLKYELKIRELEVYTDGVGNTVSLKTQSRETVDKERVKELLGEIRFQEVVKSSEYEVLKVLSQEAQDRMKAFRESKKSS